MSYERMARRVSSPEWRKHLRPWGKRVAHGVVRMMDRPLIAEGLTDFEQEQRDRWPSFDPMDYYDPPPSREPTAPHCETCCCDLRSTRREPS